MDDHVRKTKLLRKEKLAWDDSWGDYSWNVVILAQGSKWMSTSYFYYDIKQDAPWYENHDDSVTIRH